LDPDNRDIQSAHFDALIQFAKSLGEEEPKRARYLLDLAARISPYNLALENAAKYLSEKRRDKAVRDCTEQVTVLRESCELEKALQLVEEVAERHKLRSDPELAGLRLSLLEDLGFAESVRETQDSNAILSSSHTPPSVPSRLPFEQEPPAPMEPNLINRFPGRSSPSIPRRSKSMPGG
jgi:hypothetical protein